MSSPPKQVGRYMLFDEIASGGMGSVRLGRLMGPAGFSRIVVVKSLHAFGESAPEWRTMLLDEARLASRVRHPNVVPIIDVIEDGGVHLVMDYIEGESLSSILRASEPTDRRLRPPLALGIMHGVLLGLHAAHEARSERGTPLGIVHRDVSPQNVLLGADGTPRLIDFGVAKAQVRLTDTKDGVLKGKIAYMAPELLSGEPFDRRVDIYAASVMLWELLVGQRLFDSALETALVPILQGRVTPPKQLVPSLAGGLDAIVMKGLAVRPEQRFQTAAEMAEALEPFAPLATSRELGELVRARAGTSLARRSELVAHAEMVSVVDVTPVAPPRDATPPSGISPPPVAVPLQPVSEPRAQRDPAPPPSFAAQSETVVPAAQPETKGARRSTAAAVLAAMALGAAIAVWLVRERPSSGTTVIPTERTSSAPGSTSAAPAASGSSPALSPAPSASALAPDSPPSAPTASPPPPAPGPAATGVKGRRPATAAPAPPAANCDPPFSLTPAGVKVPKPGCF